MNEGFVLLYRKTLDSRVFQSEGLFKVWIWCLLKATHKEIWVPVKTGKGTTEVHLLPGQFIFGRDSAAKQLKMKPSTVRNRMEKLNSMQNLDIEKDSQYSVVTVVNWDSYQSTKKIRTAKRTAVGQPKDTNNNVNNVKKEIYSRVISHLNQKTGKNFSPKTKGTKSHIDARLSEGFTEPDFLKVINNKCSKWLGDPNMREYLRPQTLFGNKFEGYLQDTPEKKEVDQAWPRH